MKPVYDLRKQEVKEELIPTLESIRGEGTHLVSLYVSKNLDLARSRIKSELTQLTRIQSKKTQKLVTCALNNILEYLKQPLELPLVIFSYSEGAFPCILPGALAKDDYICDKVFDLSDLRGHSETRWGLVVLDTRESTIGLWQNGRITPLSNKEYMIPPKIAAGGQSAQRFDETRDIVIDHALKDVISRTYENLRGRSVSKIIVGGIKPHVDNYYLSSDHPPEMKALLLPPLPVSYTNQAGLEMLVKKASQAYRGLFEEYLEYDKRFSELMAILARGQGGSIAKFRGFSFEKDPQFHLVAGVNYDDRYCQSCKLYDNVKFCEHQTVPISEVTNAIIFKPGMNGDHIKTKYRGVVSSEEIGH